MSISYTPDTEKRLALLYAELDQIDEGVQIIATETPEQRERRVKTAIEMAIAADGKRLLYVPINKKWFDMIEQGIKKEEYREIGDHWDSRLITHGGAGMGMMIGKYKEFDIVRLTNGYGTIMPTIDVEHKGTRMGVGNPEWGAPMWILHIISLGKVLRRWNLKK